MTKRARLAAFAVGLALAFGGGALAGAAVGPDPDPPTPPDSVGIPSDGDPAVHHVDDQGESDD